MKLSTKITIGSAISVGIGIWVSANQKDVIEHRLKRQIIRHFKNVTDASIYGTWMRKLNANPFNHHYHGGINVKLNNQLYQYRFVTNRYGKIKRIKLINRVPYPTLEI